MNEINFKINGHPYSAFQNETVLQVALRNGIDIPHFCHHDDLPTEARCRTCLVELDGKVMTSCNMKPTEGMEVLIDTPQVHEMRRVNMELLLAGHREYCPKCKDGIYCRTSALMEKYGISGSEYKRPRSDAHIHKMCQAAEIDPQLCIACNKCVEICEKTGSNFLKMKGKNVQTHAAPTDRTTIDCIYCGQCTVHCPVGAVREQSEIEPVERALNDSEKVVIAQMAPSVRVSIGEEFGMPVGTNMTRQAFTAFRSAGFDKVFDVNMGADITTIVEARELVERIKENKNLPMFTSCCPAWVKYVEFYHPDLIPHLTTSRSPQIHAGAIYKTWWAEKENIDPKNIVVVSFMPCTSKKYEARHKKLKVNGMRPVDYVLTTREMGALLKKRNVDITQLEPSDPDCLGSYSGAAVIYGASGGVMESALRTAYFELTGEELDKVEFENVRGIKGIKKAEVKIGDRVLKIAVVTTAKNVNRVITEIMANKDSYDYVEVMACHGGCIGGGGQPIPTTMEIVKKRIQALYDIDSNMELRKAHLNPIVKDLFENYINKLSEEERRNILETNYSHKNKYE